MAPKLKSWRLTGSSAKGRPIFARRNQSVMETISRHGIEI